MTDADLSTPFEAGDRRQTAIERAIFQEAYLAQSLLCAGMTAVRRASFDDPGRAYEGFFGLANGIERTAKLILVSDHYAHTGTFPDTPEVTRYGHNLKRLLQKVEEVAQERGVSLDDAPSTNPGSKAVVRFLTKFAETDRYYNINRLAQGDGATVDDPLRRWVDLVGANAPENRRLRRSSLDEENLMRARFLDAHTLTIVNFNSLSGENLGNVERAVLQGQEDEWAGVEGMLLALRPLRFLTRTISRLNQARDPLPYFSEIFFDWNAPDSSLRRRRGFPRGRN